MKIDMRQVLGLVIAGMVILAAGALRAAETGNAADPAARTSRMVFAHYMVCYGSTLEFYKQEIELAQRHGIDGFALNCGQWLMGDGKPGPYVQSAERLYEAARQLNSGFVLMMSPDHIPGAIPDMVRRFKDHPNQFQHSGKPVLSSYGGDPSMYIDALARLDAEGIRCVFVPNVSAPKWLMAWSFETVLRLFQSNPAMDGIFHFSADGSTSDLMVQNALNRRVTQFLGKICMAGIAPAYNSANLRDWSGMAGYGARWESIIRDDPEWVEIVTWNDYNEDSNLMPFRWKEGWQRQYYDRDESFLDVTGYYSAWFKTGAPPPIPQDKIYLVYRTRSKWQREAWDPKAGEWVDLQNGPPPYDQIHDDVGDFVYVTAFLTEPARLQFALGALSKDYELPAGISHLSVPLQPGTPRFLLTRGPGRGAKVLADVSARKMVIGKTTPENSVRGYHLLNRTWTAGLAVGPVWRLEAESGATHSNAMVVKEEAGAAVLTRAEPGSGFTLRVKGLETATYNVRIVYRNPTAFETRLTFTADGPPRAEKEFPYYIPAILPPTGRQAWTTTSFLWSLYSNTTFIALQFMPVMPGDGTPNEPHTSDHGTALIDAIELVKVNPVVTPPPANRPYPELVPIPGGTFTMGSANRAPDERPPHSVKIAPFAIGRCEVTNEEFERFTPSHRRLRDGFSWRNREPVIYVSWLEAALYCNWLSAQNGLTPVYDEKTWAANLKATGFRLPTEAEWEYVASGRGKSAIYPWGDEPPSHGLHGSFEGRPLGIDPRLRSDPGGGVIVVGSFPAGASRDGILDMAGNVAEWCSDTFQLYTNDDQDNPCVQTPSNYRIIRGGSWGYYGLSQRCADREFNSPQYGGYIYIGFRIAISEKGFKSLQDR